MSGPSIAEEQNKENISTHVRCECILGLHVSGGVINHISSGIQLFEALDKA